MSNLLVIPARYESSRFPGKPLAYFEDYSSEVGGVYGSYVTPANEDELSFGPEYSYRVSSIANPSAQASILPNLISGPQKHPRAKTAISIDYELN